MKPTRRGFLASLGAGPVLAKLMHDGPQVPDEATPPTGGDAVVEAYFHGDPVDEFHSTGNQPTRYERALASQMMDAQMELNRRRTEEFYQMKLKAPMQRIYRDG